MNPVNQFDLQASIAWHSLMDDCHNEVSIPIETLYRIALIRYLKAIEQSNIVNQSGNDQ